MLIDTKKNKDTHSISNSVQGTVCEISGPGTLAAGQSLFPFASVAEVLRLGGLWSGLSGWVIFSTLVEQETLTMLAEDCQRWRGLPAGQPCVPGWLTRDRGEGRG